MKYFTTSILVAVIGLVLSAFWGGPEGLAIAGLLTVMEITLSFDNAVVNAAVLKQMDAKWQKRFLTWGILVAVVGMRLIFPVLIVALATGLGLTEVARLAFRDPEAYSAHVASAHVSIASFGAMFLMMVFLQFFFTGGKEHHWLGKAERKLEHLGKLESAEVVVALILLLIMQGVLEGEARLASLISGIIGIVAYVLVKGVTALAGGAEEAEAGTRVVAYSGFMGFMYLQLLDSSFSLDGVIGAFAMSNDVVIIMLGLGIGAIFVRSLTVYLVHKGTLDSFVYLEHGAHYGIGALAFIMLASLVWHVPEVVTGLVGVALIGLSFLSSLRYRKRHG